MSTELQRGLDGVLGAASDLRFTDGYAGLPIHPRCPIHHLPREPTHQYPHYHPPRVALSNQP